MGVELAHDGKGWAVEDSLAELRQLALTAGMQVVGSVSQKLRTPNPGHYIGKGKIQELFELKGKLGYDLVVFDDELSPSQQRTLEELLATRVLDRTALILDIFARRARTSEGRWQVELAQYEYLLPRLTGRWTHLSRQIGVRGARGGPGETQLEVDRRRVRQRIADLKRELERVRRHRTLYRQRRQYQGVPVVALVGYTNAGKSTLFNALTRTGVLTEDRLFATLDPTTRRVGLPGGREFLLSDTVGFIQKLPPTVVAAFRATLEELHSADLLLHVLDITHPNAIQQNRAVGEMLVELGLSDKPMITALNKVDRMMVGWEPGDGEAASGRSPGATRRGEEGELEELSRTFPEGVVVSALAGWGLEALLLKIETILEATMVDITVQLPYEANRLIALFRDKANVTAENYTAQGTVLQGKIPHRFVAAFRPYAVQLRAR